MLTRFVRIQLAIFTVVGTIGVIAMVLFYIQAPTLLGIGRMTVTLELPATGGLYRFSNVTYRGVQLGKVTSTVEGDIDLLGILGLSDGSVRNGYQQIKVTFHIEGDADDETLRKIVEQSRRRSAVYDALTNPTPVVVDVVTGSS